ncbi:DUF6415 family natural product biosynthesis protein [Streptomyces sp. NPDC004629]|uniref:DUF6415 family natural product biosynthesis protein n=1 Tax=Streptomyces sp. NPDC004629 TaxID=3364705 RepID=UPI0036ACCFDD
MTVSDPGWTPPLDATELATVLESVRRWRPFDGDALLDDVGEVLDNVVPAEENVGYLADLLGDHLAQLVNIAVAAEASDKDPAADCLIQQARAVGAKRLPAGPGPAAQQTHRSFYVPSTPNSAAAALRWR